MKIKITEEKAGSRIDKVISEELPELSRSQIQKYIGGALVNGKPVKKNYKVQENDLVEFEIPESDESTLQPIKDDLEIVHEESDILVINKPAGLAVHPDKKISHEKTLVNVLIGNNIPLSSLGGNDRPGIVHRLDMDTSGLIIIAKTNEAYSHLRKQFENKEVKKKYTALTIDTLKPTKGKIESPIGRDIRDRKKMSVRSGTSGKHAVTEYEVTKTLHSKNMNTSFSLLDITIPTGRTHQIRVHLSSINHPIIGDQLYGNPRLNKWAEKKGLKRQFLHARELEFTVPSTGEKIKVTKKIPSDLESFSNSLDQ